MSEANNMSNQEAMKLALDAAYLAGFNASGEGYNGEYPFGDKNQNPEHDSVWCKDRDNALEEALAVKQEQRSVSEQLGEPWGACVSGRVFVGALPEHIRKLSEDEGMPIQWLYTTPQPKQEQGEPVAWYYWKTNQAFTLEPPPGLKAQCQPLYATPQSVTESHKRKPLTDEQADSIINGLRTCLHRDSKRDFLKTWLRDWAAHGMKENA